VGAGFVATLIYKGERDYFNENILLFQRGKESGPPVRVGRVGDFIDGIDRIDGEAR
jgi:hypothetical protein